MAGSGGAKVGASDLRVVLGSGELESAVGRVRADICAAGASTGDRSSPDLVAH